MYDSQGVWLYYQEDFRSGWTILHTFVSRASLDSDGGVRVFASKFFDCFPGKMVLFADMLVGKGINLAIDEVNLRVKISIIKIFLGLNQRDVVE